MILITYDGNITMFLVSRSQRSLVSVASNDHTVSVAGAGAGVRRLGLVVLVLRMLVLRMLVLRLLVLRLVLRLVLVLVLGLVLGLVVIY